MSKTTWQVLQRKMKNNNQDSLGFAFAKKVREIEKTYIQKWQENKILTFDIAKTIPREILSFPVDVFRIVSDPKGKRTNRRSLIGKTLTQAQQKDDAIKEYISLATEQSKFVIDKAIHPIQTIKNRIGDENVKGITNLINLKTHQKMSLKRTGRTILGGLRK